MNSWKQPEALPYDAMVDSFIVPFSVYRPDGLMVYANRVYEDTVGVDRAHIIQRYNVFADPQFQDTSPSLPDIFALVMRGEVYRSATTAQYDLAASPYETSRPTTIWYRSVLFPIADTNGQPALVGALLYDVTDQVQQQKALEQARRAIEQQQATIQELSSPVVQLWEDILLVPIIGQIGERRATAITEGLLEAIVRFQASSVILDVTGVETFDTQVANALLSMMRATRLLGCHLALVGISSESAVSIVRLGVELHEVMTFATLQNGLKWAFAQQGLQVRAEASVR